MSEEPGIEPQQDGYQQYAGEDELPVSTQEDELSAEEPHSIKIDADTRIENPEKAQVMANAGDYERSQAATLRRIEKRYSDKGEDSKASYFSENAQGFDSLAQEKEEEASRKYDLEQSRIQNPDKAQVMALAGNEYRAKAAEIRAKATEYPEDSKEAELNREVAKSQDVVARQYESVAGRQYDRETGVLPERKESSEEIERTVRYKFSYARRRGEPAPVDDTLEGEIIIKASGTGLAWRRFRNDVILKPHSGIYPRGYPIVEADDGTSMTFAEFDKLIGGYDPEDIPPLSSADMSGTDY